MLVHLVKRDQHATAMLDHSATDAGSVKTTVKERLDELLMTTGDITDDLVKEVCVIDMFCAKVLCVPFLVAMTMLSGPS